MQSSKEAVKTGPAGSGDMKGARRNGKDWVGVEVVR